MIERIINFINGATLLAGVVMVFVTLFPWSLLVIPPFMLWRRWALRDLERFYAEADARRDAIEREKSKN